MAEGKEEDKKVAKLSFGVDTTSLDKLNETFKEMSNNVDNFTNNITNKLNGALKVNVTTDLSKALNIEGATKDVVKFADLSKKQQSDLSSFNIKSNVKTSNEIKKIKESEVSYINKKNADVKAHAEKNASDLEKKIEESEIRKQESAYKSMLKQEEYNNRVYKSTRTMYDKIMDAAQTYLMYTGFNELKQGISETIDEMVEMQSQMVAIDRVMENGLTNIDAYRDKLIQLAYDYGNSFSNVADITLRLAQAGFDEQEALALTEKTLLALNTADLNATQATSDMIAVMAQWGLMTGDAAKEAEDYGAIIDKINKVADHFPTTSEDIMAALKKTSSAFNLAGADIDETIATIVAAEKASQRGGKEIGTALSNIIQQLKEAKKIGIAEDLGISFYTDETKTEFKDIMTIFSELSSKMQELKEAGKENSTEMQNLLEIFTVFRRNVGASLLGEMAGEESTYAQILKTSIDSIGYSLEENTKYMRTAEAAQAQFNAELLKLKTEVWDGGLENLFRDMLSLSTNLIDNITKLTEKFGVLPTTLGAVVAVLTVLKNKIKIQDLGTAIAKVQAINTKIKETGTALQRDDKILKSTSGSFKNYVTSVDKGKVSLVGYGNYLAKTTIKTALLTAGTLALNAALTAGLSLAITAITSALDNLINSSEKYIEKQEEIYNSSIENAAKYKEEADNIIDLIEQYKELASIEDSKRTYEQNSKLIEIQEKINEAIKNTGKQVKLVTIETNEEGKEIIKVNESYKEQLNLVKEISVEKKRQQTEELKTAAQAKENQKGNIISFGWKDYLNPLSDYHVIEDQMNEVFDYKEMSKDVGNTVGILTSSFADITTALANLDFDSKVKQLNKWKKGLEEAQLEGKNVTKAYEWVTSKLKELENQQEDATEAINDYKNSLAELYKMSGQVENFDIFLSAISESYDIEGPKKLVSELQEINQEFSEGKINIDEYFNKLEEKIKSIDFSTEGKELEANQAIFAAITENIAESISYLGEGFESGTINFLDYSDGLKDAAKSTLELRAEQQGLQQDIEGVWRNANGEIDDYAESLRGAIGELDELGDLLKTIGDNYDYITVHANSAGEAIFEQSEVNSKAYQNLASSIYENLSQLQETNSTVFDNIVNDIIQSGAVTRDELINQNGDINDVFSKDAQSLSAAVNSTAKQTGNATGRLANSMGKVIESLGKAISDFKYNISFGLSKIDFQDFKIENTNIKFKLPSLKFDIKGEGGTSTQDLSNALVNFGNELGSFDTSGFAYIPTKNNTTSNKFKTNNINKNSNTSNASNTSKSSSSSDSKSEAKKAEEEAYKKRLAAFKDYITEKERLESRWVSKQKELGNLATDDYLYITQQRIERYKQYLEEVKKATWMNEEDRVALEKTYSEKIEDLQVDYLGYLKDRLDDEISALKEANEKKIQLIEDEADKRINALKKVESENDRIRAKEEYEEKRKTYKDDISYWEQRTGREAQEKLLEARKNLEDLDKEWKEKQEDWNIDDQIDKIEAERDAQIAAIKEAQEKEIESMQAIYDAKVKMFSESGQLIYENSVIQSQALAEAYRKNFIEPISNELSQLNSNVSNENTQPATDNQYEEYAVKRGDTLSKIAARYNTTISKIMAANPFIKNKNKIYTGNVLQIPKFHEGGIVGGNAEAFALLKPNEVVLKPEWARGINKLARMADQNNNSITNNTNSSITVKGNLVNVEANLKNQTDIDYLTRKIEKTLENKFNIKK